MARILGGYEASRNQCRQALREAQLHNNICKLLVSSLTLKRLLTFVFFAFGSSNEWMVIFYF